MIQIVVLACIAIFLIYRLKNVLGTRDGFERPPLPIPSKQNSDDRSGQKFEVIEGGVDRDITDHVDKDSDAAKALADMKSIDQNFDVTEFLGGARSAYEMILMAFEGGDLEEIKPFLSDEVYDAFQFVVDQRNERGLAVDANFVGVRDLSLLDAEYDHRTREGELKVRFVGELISVVRDEAGDIVEGDPNKIKRQRDIWTFARTMGSDDPNWKLVATSE